MKLLQFSILAFSLISWYSLAQPYSSAKGSFQISQKQGCAPLTISLNQLIGASFTAEYNYEGGSVVTLSKSHTFNLPGIYTVVAIYNGLIPNSTDNSDNIHITVTENIPPEFEISSCSNAGVSVKVLDNHYSQYLVDFNNDNTVDKTISLGGTQSETFQYSTLANQTITIRGRDTNGADNCTKKSQVVSPLAALPPAAITSLSVTASNSVELNYTPAANIEYRGVIATDNANSFQIFQTFNSADNSPQTLTLSNLANNDHYYCFKLNAYDPCNNTNVASNIICSVNLNLSFASNVNQLTWTSNATGVDDFTIKRDQTDYQTITGTSYNDVPPNIICNTDYCYTVVANYSDGSKSSSQDKCGKSFSTDTPSPIQNSSAVVNGNALDLTWVQDTLYTPLLYSINRSANAGSFSSIGTSTTPSYTDNPFISSKKYCYQITYTDACQNLSPDGNLICPIILEGVLTRENFVDLQWTEYKGWKDGVKEYLVVQYDINENQIASYITTTLTLEDNTNDPNYQFVEYQVTALPNDTTLAPSVSNKVKFTKVARLIFPTAFTPNRDNLNETFTVIGQYVENLKLQIFDRWGTLIFSTENSEAWDGTQQGRPMPESTYVWKAFITDKTGRTSTRIGSVALLRK